MKVSDIQLEEAKKDINEYDYILATEMSKVVFGSTSKAAVNWSECTEAYIFGEKGEIHLYKKDGELVVKVIKEEDNNTDFVDRSYPIHNRFLGSDKKITVRQYLEYDDDGQCYVAYSRLVSVN